MLNKLDKWITLNLSKKKRYKVLYSLLSVILFSIIYYFFPENSFAGWININKHPFSELDKQKIRIFYYFSKEYKDFFSYQEFIKLPIVKRGSIIYILDKKTKETEDSDNLKVRIMLFNEYQLNEKVTLEEFMRMPINVLKFDERIRHFGVIPNHVILTETYAVNSYFDCLYYSIITQTLCGFGDIFPNTMPLRFVSMSQALTSFIIIIY